MCANYGSYARGCRSSLAPEIGWHRNSHAGELSFSGCIIHEVPVPDVFAQILFHMKVEADGLQVGKNSITGGDARLPKALVGTTAAGE
jgi:hypothetical protein